MSPILTSTPAAQPVYPLDAYYPNIDKAAQMGPGTFDNFNANRWSFRPGLYEPPTGSGPITVDSVGVGGGGVIKRYENANGVAYALRFSSTGVVAGETIRVPMLFNAYDPGAAAGAYIGREDLRCFWWQESFLYTGSFGDAGCGRVWSWDSPVVAAFNWAQAGVAVQQHGIFGNGAGGLEYRSYSAAPALLETVAIPGVALGSWIVADHQFIAWAPGRPASYQLRVNGTAIVTRNYGVAALPFPLATGLARLQYCIRMTVAGGVLFVGGIRLRGGRFTIDGLELRA